jgi:hypothetical protein
MSFRDKALDMFGASEMWQSDSGLVAAAAQYIALCMTGDQLKSYGQKLAQEGLSPHDRQLLGGMYRAKELILKNAGVWNLKAVEPNGVFGDGSPTLRT